MNPLTYDSRTLTIDGDLPGHEFRGDQFTGGGSSSSSKSDEAVKATMVAAKAKTPKMAYSAHKSAEAKHTEAAKEANASGDRSREQYHKSAAAAHRKAARAVPAW